ncbi:winged helix-turn-helix transcriptional regulator [Kitasatospora indigofera]|uniref:winged helix-turn-helix transcriptional regulator n=1 Tax=Kitasatospora indigofera TaxID=67307 RepID=UPI00364194E6
MPTVSVVRDTARAPQVQQALSVLSPPNTISVLRTLSRNGDALPTSAFADAMPWMDAKLGPRLTAMEASGLISRSRSGRASVVSLTDSGREALQVQLPLTKWASAHQSVPETGTGLGAYTEQALASLNRTFTVATLWALANEDGPAYPSEIQDHVVPEGTHPSALYRRLAQLESAGLVERSGEHRFYLYELTPAGRALLEPLEALATWSHRHLTAQAGKNSPPPERTTATAAAPRPASPSAVSAPAPSAPSPAAHAASRSQAASLRSATAALTFSHQAAAQPAPVISSAPAALRR